jgi:hypothetical protein
LTSSLFFNGDRIHYANIKKVILAWSCDESAELGYSAHINVAGSGGRTTTNSEICYEDSIFQHTYIPSDRVSNLPCRWALLHARRHDTNEIDRKTTWRHRVVAKGTLLLSPLDGDVSCVDYE